jgi:hypothetical protein
MHFTKSISSVLVNALLASSALGAAIGRPAGGSTHVFRREIGQDGFKKMAQQSCENALKRRALAARDEDVDLREAKGAGPGEILKTEGLSTCIGIAITGDRKEGTEPHNHFMAHLVMDETGGDVFEALKGLVEEVKGDLENLKGWITTADLTDEAMRALIIENLEPLGDDPDEEEDLQLSEDQYDGEIPEDYEDLDPALLAQSLVDSNKKYYTDQFDAIRQMLEDYVGVAGSTTHDPLGENEMTSDGENAPKVNGETIVEN